MSDTSQIMSVLVWLLAIVGLAVVALLAYRMLAGKVQGRRGMRLGISEFYELDKNRRLVLVRRDNVEHLVMIGGGQDIVIETGIPAMRQAQQDAPPAGTTRAAPVTKPAAFAERKPLPRPVDVVQPPGNPKI